MERSKELTNIYKAIEKYVEKHEGKVSFIGSFLAFDNFDECNIIDDEIVAFGLKDTINLMLDDVQNQLKSEKKDFIEW